MRQRRVYVDNSVFGGVFDEEFHGASARFFELVEQGEYRVLISAITLGEIADAPEPVRRLLEGLVPDHVEAIAIESEAQALAEAYLDAGVVGASHRADATQVAAATVAKADLILSWNFRHIVNFDRIHRYNAVNLMNGYALVEIRSPPEVVYGNEDEDL